MDTNSTSQNSDDYFKVLLDIIYDTPSLEQKFQELESSSDALLQETLAELINDSQQLRTDLMMIKQVQQQTHMAMSVKQDVCQVIGLTGRMDQLIANEDFDTAIDIMHRINALNRRYGLTVSLIDAMNKTMINLRGSLIFALLRKLESTKTIDDSCMLDTINQIRRCDILSDRDLRFKYLLSRDAWFEKNVDENDKIESFVDFVEACHQFLPSILVDYSRIFGDNNKIVPEQVKKFSSSDSQTDECMILNSWLLLKITTFIESLRSFLQLATKDAQRAPSKIMDTVNACFRFGASMADYGLDIRPQLAAIFVECLVIILNTSIDRITNKFEEAFAYAVSKSIDSLSTAPQLSSSSSSPLSDSPTPPATSPASLGQHQVKSPNDDNVEPSRKNTPLTSPDNNHQTSQTQDIPKSIEEFPIFHNYCSQLCECLQYIQMGPGHESLVNLCADLYKCVNSSLLRLSKALSTVSAPNQRDNHPILVKISIIFITELVPYISTRCQTILPSKLIFGELGLSTIEFNKLREQNPSLVENLSIDLERIFSPLRLILPDYMAMILSSTNNSVNR